MTETDAYPTQPPKERLEIIKQWGPAKDLPTYAQLEAKMTAGQWLALWAKDKKKFALKLAKVLSPKEEWKHNWSDVYIENQSERVCTKCDALSNHWRSPCPIPNPIKLDWNTAKAEQAKYCGDLFRHKGRELYDTIMKRHPRSRAPWDLDYWIAGLCKPEDAKLVLIICAMVVSELAKEQE